jgi:predicted SAM-dependent methyltransferase
MNRKTTGGDAHEQVGFVVVGLRIGNVSLKEHVPSPVKAAVRSLRGAVRGNVVVNKRLIRKAPRPLKLHLGSGSKMLPGFLNIDANYFPGAVRMRLPAGLRHFPGESVSFVYCSHMLSQLDYPDEVHRLAIEVHRILVPGGATRFVVPGIERIIRAYVANNHLFFKQQERHHPPSCTTKMEHLMYALQEDGRTKYGYDFETAEKFLRGAGFARIIDSDYNKSEFPELRVDYRGENLSLFVDAVK